MTIMAMTLMQSGVETPAGANPMGPSGPFSLADPDTLRQMIADAGFNNVTVEPVDQIFEFSDPDEAWERMSKLAGPIAVAIAGLDDVQREKVRQTYKSNAEHHRSEDGIRLPGQALCVLART